MQSAGLQMLKRLKTSLSDELTLSAGKKGGGSSQTKQTKKWKYKFQSKHKNWMVVTRIGQKISQFHLMLKSTDRALLHTHTRGG
jgi:hypothetical protein